MHSNYKNQYLNTQLRIEYKLHHITSYIKIPQSATNSTFKTVCQCLSMRRPVLIRFPPHRQTLNILIMPKISEFSVEVRNEIKHPTAVSYPKTIVFCRTYRKCADSLKQILVRFSHTHQVIQTFLSSGLPRCSLELPL